MRDKYLYESYHRRKKTQKRVIKSSNFTYRILLGVIRPYLEGRKKILDIGCGVGTIDFYLASIGKDVLGVDVSKNAIKLSRENAKLLGLSNKAKFLKLDFPNEIPTGRFDLIVCSEVLEHIRDDKRALAVMYKLLKPKGVLVLSTPSCKAPLYRWGIAKNFDKKVGHLRRYSITQLQRMFGEAGYKVLEIERAEGALRNFLFVNPYAEKVIRLLKGSLSDVVTILDNLTIPVFGESNIFIAAGRPK